jgi:hypothetical protein
MSGAGRVPRRPRRSQPEETATAFRGANDDERSETVGPRSSLYINRELRAGVQRVFSIKRPTTAGHRSSASSSSILPPPDEFFMIRFRSARAAESEITERNSDGLPPMSNWSASA